MLRILADENFPGDAVKALKNEGYDVEWIQTIAPGSNDKEVLRMALEEKRILITFDKDFGELAFRYGLPAYCGIILFRITLLSPSYVVKKVVETLKSRSDWEGYFSVVEVNRIRVRPLMRVLS
jgi:predicted nuclease of predicted toxin-antitoxin system